MMHERKVDQSCGVTRWSIVVLRCLLSVILLNGSVACDQGRTSLEGSVPAVDLNMDFEPPLEDVVALYLLTHPKFDSTPSYRKALIELVLSDSTILNRVPKVKQIILSDLESHLKVDFIKPNRTEHSQSRLRIHSISKSGQRLLFLSKSAACVLDHDTQDIVQVVWSGTEIDHKNTHLSDDGSSLTLVSKDMVSIHDLSSIRDSVVMASAESHIELGMNVEQVVTLENNEGVLILQQSGDVVYSDFAGQKDVLMKNIAGISKVPNKNWVMLIQHRQSEQDVIYFDVSSGQEMHRFTIDGQFQNEGWMSPGHLFAGITEQKKLYVFDVSRQQTLVDLLLPIQPTELLIHPSLPYLVLKMGGVYQVFDVERDRLDPIQDHVIVPQFDQRGNLHYLSIGPQVSEFYRRATERDVYSETWLDLIDEIYDYNRTYVLPKVYNFSTKEYHEKYWHSGIEFPIGYGLSAFDAPDSATRVRLLSEDAGTVYQVSESLSVDKVNQLDIQQWRWEAKRKIATTFAQVEDQWYPVSFSDVEASELAVLPNHRVLSRSGDCFYFDLKMGQPMLESCDALYLVNPTMVAIYDDGNLTVYNTETDDVLNQISVQAKPTRVVCDTTCRTIATLFPEHWMIDSKSGSSRKCTEASEDCAVADWLDLGLPLSGLLPRLKFEASTIPLVRVPDLAVQHTNVYSLTHKYWVAMTQESDLPSTPQQFFALQQKEYNGYSTAERLDAAFENTMHFENVWYDKTIMVAYDRTGKWGRIVNVQSGAIKDLNLTYGRESVAMDAVFDFGPAVQNIASEDILREELNTHLSKNQQRICPGTWEVVDMPINEKLSSFVPNDLVKEYCQ